MEEFPVFVKEGAIIPLAVKRKYTGLGDIASEGFVTILIFPNTQNSFAYYHPRTNEQTKISYRLEKVELKIHIRGAKVSHILRIHSSNPPKNIVLDGQELSFAMWSYDQKLKKIIIKTNLDYDKGNYTIKF